VITLFNAETIDAMAFSVLARLIESSPDKSAIVVDAVPPILSVILDTRVVAVLPELSVIFLMYLISQQPMLAYLSLILK